MTDRSSPDLPRADYADYADYIAALPKKRMAAGVLFRDRDDRVLLLKTSYKPNLEVPGGVVEAGEAPWEAAAREVAEELGWDRPLGRLLVVDYVLPQGFLPEGLMFVFDGGLLDETDVSGMVFGDGEVVAASFHVLEEARVRLNPLVADRVAAASEAVAQGVTALCRHGRRIA